MDQQGYAIGLYRLEGYKDRMAHRPGRNIALMRPAEVEAYEQGVARAERDMGFEPVKETAP